MASFEELMNLPSSEIKPPQAFPVGTYHCIIDGVPTHGKSAQQQTDFFQVKFKVLDWTKDVDAAQAVEHQMKGKIIPNDYYITEKAQWRLNELCDHCDIPNSVSFKERIAELPNKQVLVTLRHEASQDGKRVFHRVAATAHV